MKRTANFEYDPEDIPKIKDEIEVMMMQIKDEAYQKGIVGERERIVKVIQDSVGSMTAEVIIERITEGTK